MVFSPAAETLQHVMKQPQPRPRRVGIVQPRYLAGQRAADHVGIGRLPAPVIALARERRPDRVPHSRLEAPRVLVKIPRVLVKYRLQDHMVNHHAADVAGISRPEPLRVAFHPLPELRVFVLRLLDSRVDPRAQQRHRIHQGLEPEVELLPRRQLANFGVTVDQTGQLSVDTAAFTSAATANFSTLLSTLGNASTGGFLQTATNLLKGIEDPITGAIKTEESSIAS